MSDTAADIITAASSSQVANTATEYVVLLKHDNHPESWEIVSIPTRAASAQEAIRNTADGTEGIYVAVPSRSWKPVTVKVEQRTFVKLEDA